MNGPGSNNQPSSDAIRVGEVLSDQSESTQQVGSDATNMASSVETAPARVADPEEDALATVMDDEGSSMPSADGTGGTGSKEGLKEVTLRTAPQDPRFPTSNQSRRCYVAYNEYHKCIKERGKESLDCRPYMRAYRSICPDEWIERWQELRDNGTWYGKY